MKLKKILIYKQIVCISTLTLALCACFHPPYNNFHQDPSNLTKASLKVGAGATIGAVAGSSVGALVGGTIGAAVGFYNNTQRALISAINAQNMQYISYGDTITIIIPTDRYFLFNSSRLNDLNYQGLNDIIKLLNYYPKQPIYVAGFTDDIGTSYHKKMLSQAQAHTMLGFLWANGINAHLLNAEGYGDRGARGDNQWIHASAYNRRIEIQWKHGTCCPSPCRANIIK